MYESIPGGLYGILDFNIIQILLAFGALFLFVGAIEILRNIKVPQAEYRKIISFRLLEKNFEPRSRTLPFKFTRGP
jgi:hypothetical protein